MEPPVNEFITSSTRNPTRPKIVNPHKTPARFADIISGIARTEKILVISGDVALAGLGLLPIDSSIVTLPPQPRLSIRSMIQKITLERPESLAPSRLVMYNRIMTERRIAARGAGSNKFLDFLKLICTEGRLAKCLTSRIDGLESRALDDMSDLVIPLYGENSLLRCASPNCVGQTESQATSLDKDFISEVTIPCKSCTKRSMGKNTQRRTSAEATCSLRPAVQYHLGLTFTPVQNPTYDVEEDESDEYVDESTDESTRGNVRGKKKKRVRRTIPVELPEIDWKEVHEFHGGSQLLLILGAQPKSPELLDLIRDLATSVHNAAGAVIYIDSTPIQGVQYHHIDMQLLGDVQEVLGNVIKAKNQVPECEVEGIGNDDIWFEIIENDLTSRSTEKEQLFTGVNCCNCGCTIDGYLVKCGSCELHYCYRRMEDMESEDSDSDEPQPVPKSIVSDAGSFNANRTPPDTRISPLGGGTADDSPEDTFPYYEACLAFNVLSNSHPTPSLVEAKAAFVCPACWDYEHCGLYPHYVRPLARESAETKMDRFPRLVMVVYYVEQFWPHTKQLLVLIANRWKQLGWECVVEPVKLQQLDETKVVIDARQWEAGSYDIMVVYMTHGLREEQGYQLDNSVGLRPAQFLEKTLSVIKEPLGGARRASAFLFGCGFPLYQPELVLELQGWLDSQSVFQTVTGCLNKRLSPVYMFNFFGKLTQELAHEGEDQASVIRLTWLRDTIAASHSNLLCLTLGGKPEHWLYAPFQSRPLGRPLPSLHSVCPCSRQDGTERRKTWKVTHNGVVNARLRDIVVKAQCRACRQTWKLPQETLCGKLFRVNGVYAAIVPYFADDDDGYMELKAWFNGPTA